MTTLSASYGSNLEMFQSLLYDFVASDKHEIADVSSNSDGGLATDANGPCCDKQKVQVADEGATVNRWSPTQIILSLTTLVLVERGSLNVNEKLSTYWPEYAAKGEKDIKVQQFLSHSLTSSECDKRVMIEDVSELIRRTDGRCLEQFITDEVARPHRTNPPQGEPTKQQPKGHSQSPTPPEKPELSNTQTKHQPEHTPSNDKLTLPTRLYPQAIPTHPSHPYAHDFSIVDQGPIGKALLTHRAWQRGDFMARFDGMTVPAVMLHTLQKTQHIHLWDPHFVGNLAHSCNPNVMLDMAEHEMWAVRDIEAGAVLSMDYASTEDFLFRTFRCECEALGCRGEVTGRKQRRGGGRQTTV